jgi:CheY-like chemotaxis protein
VNENSTEGGPKVPPGHPSGPILVVDDDADIREALCELLQDEGYRAVSAANGREALVYLGSKERPCIILLDLMMPVMDGWEFRRLQQSDPRWSEIPVIVITAAGKQGSGSIAAQRVLAKPLKVEIVLEAIEQFC